MQVSFHRHPSFFFVNRFLSNGRCLNVPERQSVYTGIAYFYRITEIQITGKYLKLL